MISASALKRKEEEAVSVSAWQNELLLIDGDEYFSALIHDINNAQQSVFLETYIFEYESMGRALVRALNKAHARGVDVRLLVDGVGAAGWISDSFAADEKVNFEIRVYHPLPWQLIPSMASAHGPGVGWIFRMFSFANSRNHRKMAIVDGRVALVGSLNISDLHLRSVVGESAWHDVAVRVAGSVCEVLTDAFRNAWSRSWRVGESGALKPVLRLPELKEKKSDPAVIRNDGRFLRYRALSRRLRFIRQAKKRVWIANAYFVPSGPLLRSLIFAARNGVDVRLLLPSLSDVNFMPWVARAFYATLIKHGVRLFEYQPRILHAKVMLIDDYATIGSTNLNHRSILHDFELDVVVHDPQLHNRLQRMFEQDFLESVEFADNALRQIPIWKELIVKFLLNFRHLL